MNKNKKRILVAMSGGIDSAVAAIMLHEQGHEVIGITMKTWDYASTGSKKKETGCCTLDALHDARHVAVQFGFPHIIVDIKKEFGAFVINNFKKEYLAGRTPNPCVLCNTHIKWEALLEKAVQLDCSHIATGHYANVRKENNRYIISKGKDITKDQSYALWGISQKNLSKTIFPLGNLIKKYVKAFAKEKGLHNLVNKSESYEICFIPDNDYRGFLKKNVKDIDKNIGAGNFILEDGTIVGKHKGYPYYTIGQRKGLGIALGYPVYVTEIQPKNNQVMLGTFDDLKREGMYVNKINMVKYASLQEKKWNTTTKIRYHDVGKPAVIEQEGEKIKVFFGNGAHAIAPGQAAVFYENDDVIGGGWIEKPFIKGYKSASN